MYCATVNQARVLIPAPGVMSKSTTVRGKDLCYADHKTQMGLVVVLVTVAAQ